MNHKLPAAFAALAFMGGIAFAAAPAAASTSTIVYADYNVVFSGSSTEDVFAGATFTMPAADSTNFNSTITGCCDMPAGSFAFNIQPVFFYGLPANTPVVNTLYGLSWLGQSPSSDPTQLHLVMGVDSAYAPGLIGQSFDDAFAGFTPPPGDLGVGESFSEQAVVDELLYTAGLDQDFGLPPNPFGGPKTNLLFDFGVYLHDQNASIVPGGSGFTLVAFSTGQSLGTGRASVVPTGAAVPEPGTWTLSIIGLALAGASLRRMRLRRA
jgi:hypothetical protein